MRNYKALVFGLSLILSGCSGLEREIIKTLPNPVFNTRLYEEEDRKEEKQRRENKERFQRIKRSIDFEYVLKDEIFA